MIVDRKELSRLMGLSISRIMQLAREGILTRVGRGRYDTGQCIHQYIDFKKQNGQSGSSDVIEARKRLYDIQTHKCELETERARQESIASDEHITDMRALQTIFNAGLESVADGLANDLAELTDAAEISARLSLETNAVRESVADGISLYASKIEETP